MAGVAPGCGAAAMGLLYPHPETSIASKNTEIVFMIFSCLAIFNRTLARGKRPECQACVIFL
jgi:hypothetical protein